MELWKEIICNLLQKEVMEIRLLSSDHIDALFESECYKALQKIKMILEDETLEDTECFMKIEKLCVFLKRWGADAAEDMILGKYCGGQVFLRFCQISPCNPS